MPATAASRPFPEEDRGVTRRELLRAGRGRKLPVYVGVNPVVTYDNFTIAGPAYLGPGYEPFAVTGDPGAPGFRVPNVGPRSQAEAARLRERVALKHSFDGLRRDID